MRAENVVGLYKLLLDNDIHIWLDGGWAVDALLEEVTRSHKDLDIAVEMRNLPKVQELLSGIGFKPKGEPNARPWNFILIDENGLEFDIHAFDFDADGNGIMGPVENRSVCPVESFTGVGTVEGQTVRCISAEWLINFHSGYELDENDIKDVRALSRRFGLKLLPEQENWSSK